VEKGFLMVAAIIYMLCALTAFACAFLILRTYLRSRLRLLLWSGLCFSGLFINNVMLVIDRVMTGPEVDLTTWRLLAALASLLPLLIGLIWEEE
jgi:hypothetical protein